VSFLLDRKSGLVAFEQGLGKTRVALEAFRRALKAGAVDALIVICPNSLKDNWAEEVARFTPGLTVSIVRGNGRERRKALAVWRMCLLLTTKLLAMTLLRSAR